MAGPAANFASILILSKTQGKRATAIYVISVVLTAILFGLMIDYLLPEQWFSVNPIGDGHSSHMHLGWFETTCSIALGVLLIFSFAKKLNIFKKETDQISNEMKRVYKIDGMNCAHCKASVEKAIASVEGVEHVEVSLSDGLAIVSGEQDDQAIIESVRLAGFEAGI